MREASHGNGYFADVLIIGHTNSDIIKLESLIKIYGENIFKGLQITEKISGKICLGSQDN